MGGNLGEHAASAVPALTKCLEDVDWEVAFAAVRCYAAEALGDLDEHAASAVPALTKCLADERAYVDLTTNFDVPAFEKPLRAKAVEKIFNALRPRTSEDEPEPMNLAVAVEQELWNQLGSSNQDYIAQLRSITFNLKERSNIEFRAKVVRSH